MPDVDLQSIARQIERVLADIAYIKNTMTIIEARLTRIEASQDALLSEVCAITARMNADWRADEPHPEDRPRLS